MIDQSSIVVADHVFPTPEREECRKRSLARTSTRMHFVNWTEDERSALFIVYESDAIHQIELNEDEGVHVKHRFHLSSEHRRTFPSPPFVAICFPFQSTECSLALQIALASGFNLRNCILQ